MNKIRLLMILMIALSATVSCGAMEKTSESTAAGSSDAAKEGAMSPEKKEQLMNSWNSDITGDGNSLYYEDGEIISKEDQRDLPNTTMDFSTGYLRKITASGWHVSIPIHEEGDPENEGSDNIVIESDSYEYKENARYYAVDPVTDLDSEIQALDEMTSLTDITDSDAAQDLRGHYICDRIYRGFFDVNDTVNAGCILLTHDEFDHIYKLTVSGTGNLSEIEYDAAQVFATFMIDFDLDEWIEKNNK